MSGENESKLVFDTLIGSDTLTKVLDKQLNVATLLTTELGKIKNQIAAAKAPLDKEGISLVGISSLRTTVELYHKLLEGKEAVAKMSTGLGLKGGDLTTLEGMINAMHKLVGVTEKYSQLSNKKLQLAAFDGTLTKEQFDQHKGNINALKAINKGYAQGQAHLDGESKERAKLGIKLVEEHTAALGKQNQERIVGERQTAAEQRNRTLTVARRIKEGNSSTNFIGQASPLEANQLRSKLRVESLRANLTPIERTRIEASLAATSSRIESFKAPKAAVPDLSFFNNLGKGFKEQGNAQNALTDLRAALSHAKKTGNAPERERLSAIYEEARSIVSKKFAPHSPHQERLKQSLELANKTSKLNPEQLASVSSRDVVAQHLRLSALRAKDLPEGEKKDDEHRYQRQLSLHGKELAKIDKRSSETRPHEADKESPTAYLNRARQHGANEEIAKTDLGFRTKVTEAQQAGALAVERQARKNKRDQELETLAKTQYLTLSSLQGLTHAEMVQASRILNYRKNMAVVAGQADTLNINLLDELSKQKTALKKQTREIEKAAERQRRLAADPDYAAKYHLKNQKDALVTNSLQDRMEGQRVADARLRTKADNDRIHDEARRNGTYATDASLRALTTPRQVQDARDALNYQKGLGTPAEVIHAKDMLQLLGEIHGKEKAIAGTDNLIAQLEKTHYQTKASLNGLGREELQQAIAVLSYRKSIATTEQQRAAAQGLLNTANQGYKVNPEHQAENRAGSRERILGDAGASVLTIQAGLMLNYKLLAGMQGLFSNAIGSVIELDSAFRQLQAISASTNTEMVSMKQNLILVAQASKFSAAEVGNTAVLLAQAGYSVGEISQSMKGIISLAQATGTDLGKSVDVVTSVLSVFNKGAGETAQVANQLTEALNRSKLDINKMALGIQYAGNIAADSGVSFEELTAALGAMANAGIRSGSTLGTGTRQMLLDLQKPSEKLQARLTDLGLSLDQVNSRSQGLVGVLENLKNAGFTTGDAFKTFEVRGAAAFAALSGNMEDFNQIKESLNDTTAAFDANGVQLEALAVQLDHLKSNLGILSAEALQPVAALVRDFAKATAHAMEKTEEGSGTLQKFGTVLMGLTVAVAAGWMAKLTFELFGLLGGLYKFPAAFGVARASMVLHNSGLKVLTGETLAATAATATFRSLLFSMAPLLIGIAVGVGAVVAAFSAWDSETDKLNDRLDKAKAAFNKAKENADAAKTAYDNVNEAIVHLSERYGTLEGSQAATTDEAQSLLTKFGEMGFTIDELANVKVEQLMVKLRELRGELAARYSTGITDQFSADVSKLIATKDTATVVLAKRENSPEALDQEAKGLLGQRGSGFASNKGLAALLEPDLREFLAGVATSLRGVSTPNGVSNTFNMTKAKGDYAALKLNSNAGAYALDFADKQMERFEGLFKAYEERKNFEANKTKLQTNQDTKLYLNNTLQDSRGAGKAVGEAQAAQIEYTSLAAAVDRSKAKPNEKILQKAALATKAGTAVKLQLKTLNDNKDLEEARLKEYSNNSQSDSAGAIITRRNVMGLSQQIAEVAAGNTKIDADIAAGEELKSKGKLQDLQIQKEKLSRELKVLKRESEDETGVAKQAGKYQLVENKQREIDAVENEITTLSQKKDADIALQLRMKALGQAAVLEDMKVQEQEKQKSLKSAVAKRTTDIDSDTDRGKLTDYKQAQQDWVEANNLSDELFAKAQSAARKRAELQGKKVLNAGNMFKDINKDLAKAAQDAANATGQAQEYSSYGTGIGGFFARQAANAKNGVNEGKLKQEALAREFLQLKASEDHYSALKLEETIPKAQAELAAKNIELKAIDDKLKNSNLSDADTQMQVRKDLQTRIDRIKEQLKTDQDLLKMSKEDRERRLAEIGRLTEDLAAMQDKTNVFADSFAAGRQALDAGLSAGFQDWATQTIKNIDDVEAAFKSMGISILQSMLKVVSDRTATAFTNMLLGKADGSDGGGLLGKLGAMIFRRKPDTRGVTDLSYSAHAAQGGFIKGNSARHYATGGSVSGTSVGHDTVPAMLMPNEYVLKPSATSALGKPFLDRLNATTTGSLKQLEGKATAPQISVVQSPPTNVYVVSPDQKNQMSPGDVVVTISDDISRNGSIKKLIKSVISGEI
jgi:TP901 family phage tail tape measure protein